MTDSMVHCGLYDPDRSTDTLLAETARGGPAGAGSAPPWAPPWWRCRIAGPGGLVDVRIEYSDLAPALRQPWTAMGSRLAEVIDGRPARHRRHRPGARGRPGCRS